MARDEKGKSALATTRTLVAAAGPLVDLGATGGVLAGASLLWEALGRSVSGRFQARLEGFLLEVADALGEEDTAKLAAALHDVESDAWDAIEAGFRTMMAAIHEDAKRCIAALVADYLKLERSIDREYQLAGGLLAQADRAFLDSLIVLADLHRKAGFDTSANAVLAYRHDGAHVYWVSRDETDRRLSSEEAYLPRGFGELVQCLLRFEYGYQSATAPDQGTPPPAGDFGPRGRAALFVSAPHQPRWERLFLYLSPARV